MFEHLDLSKLYDNEGSYGQEQIQGELTEERIKRAEENIGYKFSPAYLELLKFQNGGYVGVDDSWVTIIYGVGEEEDTFGALEDMFINWIEEWEYPNIGIPFAETEAAGHDMYFMDYRNIGPNGEPTIVHIENEDVDDIKIYKVAENLVEFIEKVLNGEELIGPLID
ncbi:MAG: SMI1/KNR4 family protein [Clostridiales bacterium]|nr:SMI1/KNR4 family protein [Clostridiales bacterium]